MKRTKSIGEYVAERFGVDSDADWIRERPDGLMDMPDGTHWRIRFRRGKRRMTVYFSQGSAHTDTPTTGDVLESVLSDSLVEADFHEFCREFGYDEDSRKAERTHKACLTARRKLAAFLEIDPDGLGEIWNAANE